MIDLHLHLDGSLSEEDFIFLAKKQHFDLGKEFPKNIYVPEDCPSLEDYLTRFDLPLALLQTPDALQYATKSLVKRLADLGFIYAEIRYAPLLHMQKGMSQLDAAKAALKGLEDGLKENKDFDANLILCCMRHADEATNMETIEVANILKNTKVVAVDLAGAEAMHPCSYYSNIFNKA
ncbi:MAG: adenosine deaminase, partial [Bacilli bacterium]|nr:adenosine deaminase [Bacilli bacterium]